MTSHKPGRGVEHDRAGCWALHDLILGQTTVCIRFHAVTSAWRNVLDETKSKRSSAVMVALELRDSCLCVTGAVKSDNASSPRSTTRLILDFCLLDLSNRGEEFNQVLVTGRPWKLM